MQHFLLIYSSHYQQFIYKETSVINLPNHKVDLLIKYLNQNHGKLSKRKWQKYFDELTEEEISTIEEYYSDIYED